ncbi:MAG: flagellar motor protein MotB [Planctomycetota bacterium]|jgi:chemotaxis protein MotB
MGRLKKQTEADEAPGAPEWMVTFSDCMTLLLTFFVLLLTFSSFDERVFHKLKTIFAGSLPSVGLPLKRDKDAFLPTKQILPTVELDAGSEKPTLATGEEDNLKEETEPKDFRSRRVFLISSKRIFWGKGTIISLQGRRILGSMASLLGEVPSRVVVSEGDSRSGQAIEEHGLSRGWAVIEHLTTRQGLDKKRFSISASSTKAQENPKDDDLTGRETKGGRAVEIVLLERSIYN